MKKNIEIISTQDNQFVYIQHRKNQQHWFVNKNGKITRITDKEEKRSWTWFAQRYWPDGTRM